MHGLSLAIASLLLCPAVALTSHALLGRSSCRSILPRRYARHTLSASKKDSNAELARYKQEIIDEVLQRMMSELESTSGGPSEEPAAASRIMDGVVRVYCTHCPPNFSMPWQRVKQDFSTASGFVIDGRRILTNAHAVEYGTLVQVKKRQSERKYLAKVHAVGHECDLAVLTVEDDRFWDDLSPLVFGGMPNLQDEVSVVGYPVGGESLSITSGVVSRIEMQKYAQASADLLAIQIDAAINPGNSGGPVVAGNEVIGVAFQSLSSEDTENIGYVVPVNVITHFLESVARSGRYEGVCSLGAKMQGMENDALRRHYRMADSLTGVLVLELHPLAPARHVLRRGDVLLAVNGVAVANDGTIPFRASALGEKVFLTYFFSQCFSTDLVELRLLRDGQVVTVHSQPYIPSPLVPRLLLQDAPATYFTVGGLVFLALSREYLSAEYNLEHVQADFDDWAFELETLALTGREKSDPSAEVVILSQVLSHTCNIGYETIRNLRAVRLNGEEVLSLAQMQAVVREATSESLVFEFSTGQVIVLDRAHAMAATDQILKEQGMPSASVVL